MKRTDLAKNMAVKLDERLGSLTEVTVMVPLNLEGQVASGSGK